MTRSALSGRHDRQTLPIHHVRLQNAHPTCVHGLTKRIARFRSIKLDLVLILLRTSRRLPVDESLYRQGPVSPIRTRFDPVFEKRSFDIDICTSVHHRGALHLVCSQWRSYPWGSGITTVYSDSPYPLNSRGLH